MHDYIIVHGERKHLSGFVSTKPQNDSASWSDSLVLKLLENDK